MPERSLLTRETFGEALDTYGHDLAQWPMELRRQAESLLTESDEARCQLQEARLIAEALAPRETIRADRSLVDRIMKQVGLPDVPTAIPDRAAEIIRPDWPSARRDHLASTEIEQNTPPDEEYPAQLRQYASKRYWAVAAIIVFGLVLGWSSGPLTLQDTTVHSSTGLASYLSL